MSVEAPVYSNEREETIRSERISKSELSPVSLSLGVGGEVRINDVIEDIEKYVGPISRGNEWRITESQYHYSITVYRTKKVCTVDDCASTASQKFDGNWLCDNHLDSYTARHF